MYQRVCFTLNDNTFLNSKNQGTMIKKRLHLNFAEVQPFILLAHLMLLPEDNLISNYPRIIS